MPHIRYGREYREMLRRVMRIAAAATAGKITPLIAREKVLESTCFDSTRTRSYRVRVDYSTPILRLPAKYYWDIPSDRTSAYFKSPRRLGVRNVTLYEVGFTSGHGRNFATCEQMASYAKENGLRPAEPRELLALSESSRFKQERPVVAYGGHVGFILTAGGGLIAIQERTWPDTRVLYARRQDSDPEWLPVDDSLANAEDVARAVMGKAGQDPGPRIHQHKRR